MTPDLFGTDPRKLHRTNDPNTSVEAAHAVDTSKLEGMVYRAIKGFGYNGCIAADILGLYRSYPYSSITARFSALERKGLIECGGSDGKDVRKGPSGRNQRVMRAVK